MIFLILQLMLSSPVRAELVGCDALFGKYETYWMEDNEFAKASGKWDAKKRRMKVRARHARRGWSRYTSDIKNKGPAYVVVRDRKEEELAKKYSELFFPKMVKPKKDRFRGDKFFRVLGYMGQPGTWIAPLTKGRRFAPIQGTFETVDRLVLGKRTVRGFVKMPPLIVADLVAFSFGYEKTMEWADSMGEENATRFALEHDYAFHDIQEEQNKIMEEAKKPLEPEFAQDLREKQNELFKMAKERLELRRTYFLVVEGALKDAGEGSTFESIAPQFLQEVLYDEEAEPLFKDLRYLLSNQFMDNPAIAWPDGKPTKLTSEQFSQIFAQLFELNHYKQVGLTAFPDWLSPGFDPNALESNPGAKSLYGQLVGEDPFVQKLVSFVNEGKITQKQLESLASEDLVWKIRLAQLEVYGAKINGKDGKFLTLADHRHDALEKLGLLDSSN